MTQISATTEPWKFHPIYIFGVGAIGGICFAMTWLAPAQIGNLKYEVEDARRFMEKHQEARDKIAQLEDQLRDAKRLVSEMQAANSFHFGTPYPVGFGKVRVGDSATLLDKEFTAAEVDKSNKGYWRVSREGAVVDRVTYYFDDADAEKTITHMGVFVKNLTSSKEDDWLVAKLQEILGKPDSVPEADFYSWALPCEDVFKDDLSGYLIMRKGLRPAYWPKKGKSH